jgi:hypothetical protein
MLAPRLGLLPAWPSAARRFSQFSVHSQLKNLMFVFFRVVRGSKKFSGHFWKLVKRRNKSALLLGYLIFE